MGVNISCLAWYPGLSLEGSLCSALLCFPPLEEPETPAFPFHSQ